MPVDEELTNKQKASIERRRNIELTYKEVREDLLAAIHTDDGITERYAVLYEGILDMIDRIETLPEVKERLAQRFDIKFVID